VMKTNQKSALLTRNPHSVPLILTKEPLHESQYESQCP
jgi:hypothetical protein